MVYRFLLIFALVSGSLGAADLTTMDKFRSQILTTAVSFYFKSRGYGTVENVSVDTTKKSLRFLLLPEGEKQPLNIVIGSYATKTVDKEEYLILQKVQTNRIWLNRIFADHMEEGIKVPLGGVTKGAGTLLLNI
jgi:hypothetical protein